MRDSAGMRVLVEEARRRRPASSLYRCSATGELRVGGAVEHRADQARLESREEIQRPQRGLAPLAQPAGLLSPLEQALVLAQRVLDLAVARQRGVVVDAQALRRP